MSNWLKSILAGAGATLLLFFVYREFLSKKEKQLYTVSFSTKLLIDKKPGNTPGGNIIDKIPGIIRQRAVAAWFEPVIKITGERTLDIKFLHVNDTSLARQIITQNDSLEFQEIYTLNEIPALLTTGDKIAREFLPQPSPKPRPAKSADDSTISPEVRKLLDGMEKGEEEKEMAASGLASIITAVTIDNVYSTASGNESFPPQIGSVQEKDTSLLNKILQSPVLLKELPYDIRFCYGPGDDAYNSKDSGVFYLYGIRTYGRNIPLLHDEYIKSASVEYNVNGDPGVHFVFNTSGSRIWEEMTRANIGRSIAIINGHSVISAPKVNEAISGGASSISGGFSANEASLLAARLSSSHLPAAITIIKQEISSERSGGGLNMALFILISFILTTGTTYLLFNNLKSK